MDAATGGSRLWVFTHLVQEEFHSLGFEVHVTIQSQKERVLSLEGGGGVYQIKTLGMLGSWKELTYSYSITRVPMVFSCLCILRHPGVAYATYS